MVWNRTQARAEKLLNELGENKVRIAQSAAQLAQDCDIIITNLANDEIVKQTYQQFAEALKVWLPIGRSNSG
jgi:3-hydroxyisobutyrate dehydrogenase-like beta-hydroxyacid dehydrogenase